MSSNPTASGLERVMACPASQVLPAVYDSSVYAERGTQIARFIRSIVGGMPIAQALHAVRPEWRDTCRHLEWKKVVGDLGDVRGEVAYALDVETMETTELGINIGRKYPPLGPTQIAGSDDIEGVRLDGVPVVRDVKSGYLEVTAAEDNPQLKFFALVKMLRTGASEVEAGIRYVSESGHVTSDDHVFTAFDLECFGDELREMVERVADARRRLDAGERLAVSSGAHCRYCPGMAACPRYTALAKTMLPDIAQIASQLNAMTPEQQGFAFSRAKEIETLVGTVLDSLRSIAKQKPIPLGNGKEAAEIRFKRSNFSHDAAIDLLQKKGATAAEIEHLYVTSEVSQVRVVNGPTLKRAPSRSRKSRAA